MIRFKIQDWFDSFLLMSAMIIIMFSCAYLLFGFHLALYACSIIVFLVPVLSYFFSRNLTISAYGGVPVKQVEAPELERIIFQLSQRANLQHIPKLFWIPSDTLNAFSVGSKVNSAIAVTNGILQSLSKREIIGVLAHEIAHIKNNDTIVMDFADSISRITHIVSFFSFILLAVFLPFIILGYLDLSILPYLILAISPVLCGVLQLSLSRRREFLADVTAAELTGDPKGLASALSRIELLSGHQNFYKRLFRTEDPQPSLLRTHPPCEQRVSRLKTLTNHNDSLVLSHSEVEYLNQIQHQKLKPSRRIILGIWR